MENGSITGKVIGDWIVKIILGLIGGSVSLIIFYFKYYRADKKKIKNLEKMLYKEIIARKEEKIKYLEKENNRDKKIITNLENKIRKLEQELEAKSK